MIDYAISAIGRASAEEPVIKTAPAQEAREVSFETVGSRASSPWTTIDGSGNQISIIQEASPSDGQLKNVVPPWNDVAFRVVNRLDIIQRDWNRTERDGFSTDESWNPGSTLQESAAALRSGYQKMLKFTYHMMDSQFRLTVVSSIGTTFKNSISALYRQQG